MPVEDEEAVDEADEEAVDEAVEAAVEAAVDEAVDEAASAVDEASVVDEAASTEDDASVVTVVEALAPVVDFELPVVALLDDDEVVSPEPPNPPTPPSSPQATMKSPVNATGNQAFLILMFLPRSWNESPGRGAA